MSNPRAANPPHSRVPLVRAATPLTEHPRIARRMGNGVRFFIKRDDFGEIGGGGNKLRKLEFALGLARQQSADTLVTFGALQSNHARLTAAVAARAGLRCELVLSKRVPRSDAAYEGSGNMLLMKLFGARLHLLEANDDPSAYAAGLMQRLQSAGRKPYLIPFGGSDALGAVGYSRCALEICEQMRSHDLPVGHVVVASGSGGTQAGLVAGFHAAGSRAQVHGVSVLHPAERLRDIVGELVHEACSVMQLDAPSPDRISVDDRFVGEGYGLPNRQTLEAIRDMALGDGVLLDPVYTGKAFAGLLQSADEGLFTGASSVVFVHTGGLPGLFAYASEFREELDVAAD